MFVVCCGRLTHDGNLVAWEKLSLHARQVILGVVLPAGCKLAIFMPLSLALRSLRIAWNLFGVRNFGIHARALPTLKNEHLLRHWGCHSLCHLTKWVMECWEAVHVLSNVWMLRPDQASSLQGNLGVSWGSLAVDDLGIGSGWQQSKQD